MAAGPSANRPPHILLESDLRLEIGPLLGIALLLAGCDRQSAPTPQPKAENTAVPRTPGEASIIPDKPAELMEVDRRMAGRSFPNKGFEGPDGKPLTIADFAGRPVLVNLWATWCVPCITEMPTIDALALREAGRLSIVAISQDSSRAVMARWWGKQAFKTLQPYLDVKGDFSFAYGGVALPTSIYYDAKGKEVWRITGALDWTGDEALSMIDEAFATGN